ncbi:MAG: DUF2335 domain-containing protein [Gimesia chilikensis]|uniref:DUF2335 domain-containing protein n=1 Tax=Gimesia chilikensis TaxID=2605989 RepID=UPI0037A61A55
MSEEGSEQPVEDQDNHPAHYQMPPFVDDAGNPISLPEGMSLEHLLVQFSMKFHRGPLPSPETLREYDEIVPGAAKEIIERAGKQQDHRMFLEKKTIVSDIYRGWAGLILGSLLAFLCIGGGIYLIKEGFSTTGLTAIITAVTGLVGTSIFGMWSRSDHIKKKKKKSNEMTRAED